MREQILFEKYINQKAFGAYYTRPEITEYLSEQTIHKLILDKVNRPAVPGVAAAREFTSLADLLLHLDAELCRELLFSILPKLSLLDPACGSGAFLIAAMKVLISIYSAIAGKIEFLNDRHLSDWLNKANAAHRSLDYYLKKKIITENLYGVDIMEEAVEIARLRLFLALVGSVQTVEQLEPLPNIDFNILAGNSLIGLLRVNEKAYDAKNQQASMFQKPYHEIVAEKDRLIRSYRDASSYAEDLRALRDQIDAHRAEATAELDDILLDEFKELKIQCEEYGWDAKKGEVSKKRAVRIKDIRALHPFHWGYEFAEIMNERGGFDGIITNPPWEIFKPNSKEFFQEYSDLVTKNKMRIEEFEKEQAKLLRDPDLRQAWLAYLSQYPHVSAYYRSASQFANQISIVNGKKAGSDTNLYKLFVEQCYNLLRNDGMCGIVIPSGIYTDLGTKQLRELLFGSTRIAGLFCFENRSAIFEGVDSRFKFVTLTFEKGGHTEEFPAAFMRHEVAELARFPQEGAIGISVNLVRRLSPDSLSVMEFRNVTDAQIAEKMLRFPLLGETIDGAWKLTLFREFDMTNDSGLFKNSPAANRLPLYEGKMIHHFEHQLAESRYWVVEKEGKQSLTKGDSDSKKVLDYQKYRLGFRAVARNTDTRIIIVGPIPKNVFCGNSILVNKYSGENDLVSTELVGFQAILNSFVIDFYARQMVTANINMFYIYQLPVPRLTAKDKAFAPIVERAAKLICTTPEFDDLAKQVGLKSHRDGVTDAKQRARLRAELDGMIAHLYGLTEDEFAHILATFPLVEQAVKDATMEAFGSRKP